MIRVCGFKFYPPLFIAGQVEVAINDDVFDPIFYVDHTQPLWFFVNLTHSISELRLKGMLYSIFLL